MWLLNVLTYKLKFFNSLSDVQYTILSHTWGEEEVLYRDLEHLETAQTKLGWTKIRYICQQTIEDGLLWTWIDTCCIDKHSSTELSEAINSMFSWYQSAAVCHAYFAETWDSLCVDDAVKWRRFEESRWWTRGWTLQELLAPQKVCFWDCHWAPYGQLQDLAARVSRITSIELDVLLKIKALDDVCVARKFSWASSRETTRVEDEAYALLGILGVSLPIIYGEGSKAFRRLQEEFIKSSTDLSIFAWSRQVSFNGDDIAQNEKLLADNPQGFENWANIRLRDSVPMLQPFQATNAGLRLTLPCVPVNELPSTTCETTLIAADIGCRLEEKEMIGLYLLLQPVEHISLANTGVGVTIHELFIDRFPFIRSKPPSCDSDQLTRYMPRLTPIHSNDFVSASPKELLISSSRERTQPRVTSRWHDAKQNFYFRLADGGLPPIVAAIPANAWILEQGCFRPAWLPDSVFAKWCIPAGLLGLGDRTVPFFLYNQRQSLENRQALKGSNDLIQLRIARRGMDLTIEQLVVAFAGATLQEAFASAKRYAENDSVARQLISYHSSDGIEVDRSFQAQYSKHYRHRDKLGRHEVQIRDDVQTGSLQKVVFKMTITSGNKDRSFDDLRQTTASRLTTLGARHDLMNPGYIGGSTLQSLRS